MHIIDVLLNVFQTLAFSAPFYFTYNKGAIFLNKKSSRILMLIASIIMSVSGIITMLAVQVSPSQSILGMQPAAVFTLLYGIYFLTAFITNNNKLALFGYSLLIAMLMRHAIEVLKNKQFGAFQLSMLAALCVLFLLLHMNTESKRKQQTSAVKN